MRRPRPARRSLAVLLTLSFVLAACWGGGGGGDDEFADWPEPPVVAQSDGVRILLSPGRAVEAAPVPVVAGDALPADRIAAVLARLAALPTDPNDAQDFNRPAATLKPPVAGTTVDTEFGAPERSAPDVASGPLQVLRVQPEGDVAIAPFVSVTFDQPMIPLATLAQLDAEDVPVTITPELPGRWRWLGTRTLRFEHTADEIDRLPMATEYTVTIPAGTESETGGTLAEDVTFRFTTPAPSVVRFTPTGQSMDTQPVFVAVFDQRVDTDAVLDTVTVRAGNSTVAVRAASDEEIAADDTASRIMAQAAPTADGARNGLEDRVVVFTPVDRLPTDTAISIEIGPGTPSAEGPRTTAAAQTYSGRTYGPMRLVSAECGYERNVCRPGDSFRLEFSNPIDPARFDPDLVTIDPAVGASIGAFGTIVEVNAATAGNTDYEVTVPAGLRDVFGQPLVNDVHERFEVGDARDQLAWYGSDPLIVDPLAPTPSVSVQVVNHDDLHVRAFAVDPADWPRYEDFRNSVYDQELRTPPGAQVLDTVVPTDASRGERTEVAIDLAEAFAAAAGNQLVVVVETTERYSENDDEYYDNRPVVVWVQQTTIGVDAFADDQELVVWTTDLRDGSPVVGAEVTLGSASATTDADGLATFPLPGSGVSSLTVRAGDDLAMLRADYSGWWQREARRDIARWYVFDDRGLYRPGETVSIKGWVRRLTLSGDATLHRLPASTPVSYTAHDAFGNEIAAGNVVLDDAGGFALTFDLPAGANLGQGWIEFGLAGVVSSNASHSFRIDEFRRPEFEVTARAESPAPYLFTGPVTAAATAAYYAGGALVDAPVTWQVTSRSTTYTPPNWSDFTFGIWQPWWIYEDVGGPSAGYGYVDDVGYDVAEGPFGGPYGEPDRVERFAGTTDADGTHYLRLDFSGAAPDQPLLVSASAAVEDVNRQQFASTVDLLVHSGERYIGLGGDQTFVREGEPLRIEAILTDIDGNAIAGAPVTVTAARLEYRFVDGEWTDVDVDPQTCDVTSATEPVECTFETDTGGQYRISSTVTDDAGGQNRSELTRWVSGGDAIPSRTVEQEALTLVPNQETYAPGDTAEVLVLSPFTPGNGLLTIMRNGIESTETFDVVDGGAVLRIPITEASIPGLAIQVDVVGQTARQRDDGTPAADLPPRPAFATGGLDLPVPAASRTLTVTPTPRASALEPGAATAVDLLVTDAAGRPVAGAQAAVVVVDEAVLALTGYTLRDPLALFYEPIGTYLRTEYGRRGVVLARPDLLGGEGEPTPTTTSAVAGDGRAAGGDFGADDAADTAESAPQAAGLPTTDEATSGGNATTPIAERTNFDPLAAFAPTVTTGDDGRATVSVALPDNLTRYRVMAVAVSGDDRFGAGESTITARLPLSVRPSAPRFLNFGDTFELPIVVQNQTDTPLDVDVVVEATNLDLAAGDGERASTAGRAVTVPANDRIEVRFPAAADEAGTARFRATVVSGEAADSATIELPVYTPTTTEAFASYGVVDTDTALSQPTVSPVGVVPQFGGLEITTSSTSLQTLTDAVLYLVDYPYESADAFASRILAIAALRDVFDAFDVEGVPSRAELDGIVEEDLAALAALQNDDGGWSYWRRYRESVPYVSIEAAHALVAAGAAGYAVDDATMERARSYLRTIEDHFPAEYSAETRHLLSAYALHVRDLDGDPDPAKALDLFRNDDLGLDAQAWLWPVLTDRGAIAEIERRIANSVSETAGAATFSTSVSEDAYLVLGSDRRTDGIILDALIRVAPESDLIPKVVQGLIGNQRQGRWNNIQENAFILLALKRYFDTYESETPDFVARVWLGDTYAAEHRYAGRSTESQRSAVPMAELVDQHDPTITIAREGTGRLYYRLGLRYAPASLSLDARDEGFVVERRYEAVTDPADVSRDADGTWHIRAGAEVRVRLTMVADSQRVNMALVDNLPAGLEIVNTDLATSPATLPDEDDSGDGPILYGDWFYPWYGPWFDHQNLRDDRAEAFSAWLPGGTYDYSYVARATTPGTFVVPPAKAEEIYAPEVFGRTATDRVTIDG